VRVCESAMRDLQREGGVCLGVSATGNRWQHKGKGKRRARGTWVRWTVVLLLLHC
jgi:hypothetical protein